MENINNLLSSLLTRLNSIQHTSPELHHNIKCRLEVLYKYRILRSLRTQQINRLRLTEEKYKSTDDVSIHLTHLTLSKLVAIQEWDDSIKHIIFSQTIAILMPEHRDKLQSVLSVKALKVLLALSEGQWIDILTGACDNFFTQLLTWRSQINTLIAQKQSIQSWADWIRETAIVFKKHCSQFTWTGLGGKLGQAMGNVTGYRRTSVMLGTGLGLSIDYYLGIYHIIKTIMLGSVSVQIGKKVWKLCINNRKATVNSLPYGFQLSYIPPLINVFCSGVEFLFQSSSSVALRNTIGNISGVVCSQLMAHRRSDLLPARVTQNQAAKQLLTRITLFLVGSQLGIAVYSLAENGYINYHINQSFRAFLQENLKGQVLENSLQIDSPTLKSLYFWLYQQQSTGVTWQIDRSPILFKTTCHLFREGMNAYATAICDEPTAQFMVPS